MVEVKFQDFEFDELNQEYRVAIVRNENRLFDPKMDKGKPSRIVRIAKSYADNLQRMAGFDLETFLQDNFLRDRI